ncbi:RNA polymerase sigma factor [Streptomyces hoynatensis]|uniref:RNA polymerase sigma factor n=1 Tax=Streptomyces hoynatensis TaxID=1141874 RepID=UPI001319FC37|nr:RNA polymerase sigma factor [Streptomyces hoynatensis]
MNELSPRPPAPIPLPISFEAFFEKEQRTFLTYAASRLRDRRDAEEAALEAGRRIHGKWERILAHANPTALAYQILAGVVKDFYRKAARQATYEHTVAVPPDCAYLQELRHHEELDLAMDELEATAPKQAQCVRLHFLADLAYEQVAERLGITTGAAKTNTSLGVQRLRELMDHPHREGDG